MSDLEEGELRPEAEEGEEEDPIQVSYAQVFATLRTLQAETHQSKEVLDRVMSALEDLNQTVIRSQGIVQDEKGQVVSHFIPSHPVYSSIHSFLPSDVFLPNRIFTMIDWMDEQMNE